MPDGLKEPLHEPRYGPTAMRGNALGTPCRPKHSMVSAYSRPAGASSWHVAVAPTRSRVTTQSCGAAWAAAEPRTVGNAATEAATTAILDAKMVDFFIVVHSLRTSSGHLIIAGPEIPLHGVMQRYDNACCRRSTTTGIRPPDPGSIGFPYRGRPARPGYIRRAGNQVGTPRHAPHPARIPTGPLTIARLLVWAGIFVFVVQVGHQGLSRDLALGQRVQKRPGPAVHVVGQDLAA